MKSIGKLTGDNSICRPSAAANGQYSSKLIDNAAQNASFYLTMYKNQRTPINQGKHHLFYQKLASQPQKLERSSKPQKPQDCST